MRSIDEGWIEMKIAGPIPFLVSLNNDHDAGQEQEDRDLNAPTAFEDNLRELRFFATNAGWVQVLRPMTDEAAPHDAIATGQIRAWDQNKNPFVFGPELPTDPASPLVVYFEGMKTSPKQDHIVFEYQYYKPDKTPLGGTSGKCTVVNVSFSGNRRSHGLTPHRKLLARGVLATTAKVSPTISGAIYEWTYDAPNNASFDPATANNKSSKLAATSSFTDVHEEDRNTVRLSVADPRQKGGPIVVLEPLNITAPRAVDQPTPLAPQLEIVSTKGIINEQGAKAALFRLFDWKAKYSVKDQFYADIHESDFGGGKVEVREDVNVTSPFSSLEAWFAASLTTPNWKEINADGTFTDTLGSDRAGIPLDAIMSVTPGNFGLLTTTKGQVIASIEHHKWHVTVDKDRPGLDKEITDNRLNVKTTDYVRVSKKEEQASFESRYGFVLIS